MFVFGALWTKEKLKTQLAGIVLVPQNGSHSWEVTIVFFVSDEMSSRGKVLQVSDPVGFVVADRGCCGAKVDAYFETGDAAGAQEAVESLELEARKVNRVDIS